MMRNHLLSACLALSSIAIGPAASGQAAPAGKPDLDEIMKETQRSTQKPDEMIMVWWMLEDFWKLSLGQDPNLTPAGVEDFLKTIRPYVILVVVEGSIGPFGGLTFKPEEEIRKRIEVRDGAGGAHKPVEADKIDADTTNLLAVMKPILSNMLGPLGKNINFVLFPAKTKKGDALADPRKAGAFSVKLGENEFKWKLPLGSLLPRKKCSACSEMLNGAYSFCPWDGTKLK